MSLSSLMMVPLMELWDLKTVDSLSGLIDSLPRRQISPLLSTRFRFCSGRGQEWVLESWLTSICMKIQTEMETPGPGLFTEPHCMTERFRQLMMLPGPIIRFLPWCSMGRATFLLPWLTEPPEWISEADQGRLI